MSLRAALCSTRNEAAAGDFIEALALPLALRLAEEADRDDDRRGTGPSTAAAVAQSLE
jgi:hypothetical protein